jgi:UPF0755 protein
MNKKTLFTVLILLIFAVFLSGFFAYKYWQAAKQNRPAIQNAKLPEISITLIEGWTIKDIADYLESQKLIKSENFLSLTQNFAIDDYPLLAQNPRGIGLEGFLFPDTYRIFKPKTDFDNKTGEELIKKTLDNFSKKITPAMLLEIKAKGTTLFDIIILASIIEKETGRNAITLAQKQMLDEERKIIAGIFYNRLNIGMALESDATINYITKHSNPSPTLEDLGVNSPYNTYKNKGLPPGPICNPSLSSIMAAIYPAKTDYFYFLHKQPSGEVVYSKTFEEHIGNKYKYLK